MKATLVKYKPKKQGTIGFLESFQCRIHVTNVSQVSYNVDNNISIVSLAPGFDDRMIIDYAGQLHHAVTHLMIDPANLLAPSLLTHPHLLPLNPPLPHPRGVAGTIWERGSCVKGALGVSV